MIHSGTKYLDGQGRVIAGAICGDRTLVNEQFVPVMRSAGMTLSPFNAWVVLKGLETLSIRMRAQSARALALARLARAASRRSSASTTRAWSRIRSTRWRWRSSRAAAAPWCRSSCRAATAARRSRARTRSTSSTAPVCSITANLGDTKTTITHPASTSHGRLTEEQRLAAGITQGMIRVAVGLDDVEDIKDDLLRGLGTL